MTKWTILKQANKDVVPNKSLAMALSNDMVFNLFDKSVNFHDLTLKQLKKNKIK